jgi:SRSO17 transposase
VPKEIRFKTKLRIALEQLEWACAAGLPRGVVLMDTGYGADTDLRASITTLGLSYVAGIMPQTSVWAPGLLPLPAKTWSGQGRPPKLIRRDAKHRPISAKALARGLPARAWRMIEWREGTAVRLSSRFARVRVRAAHRDYWLTQPRAEEWLLIEWPPNESEPPWLAASFILGLRINPFRYASVVHPTDTVVAQALGVFRGVFETASFHDGAPCS